jgi:hypothetical protein
MRSAMVSDSRALRGAGFGAEPDDFIENALRDFGFAHARQREIAAVAREERDDVGVAIEAGAFRGDIVGDDKVGVLRSELLSSVFRDVLGFGGKSDYKAIALGSRNTAENIGRGLER